VEEADALTQLSDLARSLRNATPGSYEKLSAFATKHGAGNLGLITVGSGTNGFRFFRSLVRETIYFSENTTNSGLPSSAAGVRQLAIDDWNGDDLPDLFVSRDGQPPLLLTKTRGGPLTETNQPVGWPSGSVLAARARW